MDYITHQAPLSVEFSRQEHWSRLAFPTPGDVPNPGVKPTCLVSPALAGGFLTTTSPGKSCYSTRDYIQYLIITYNGKQLEKIYMI